jgi:hypothetical protein
VHRVVVDWRRRSHHPATSPVWPAATRDRLPTMRCSIRVSHTRGRRRSIRKAHVAAHRVESAWTGEMPAERIVLAILACSSPPSFELAMPPRKKAKAGAPAAAAATGGGGGTAASAAPPAAPRTVTADGIEKLRALSQHRPHRLQVGGVQLAASASASAPPAPVTLQVIQINRCQTHTHIESAIRLNAELTL